MKIMLHGFGSFPAVYFHIIRYAKLRYPAVQWCILLSTDHYFEYFVDLLGRDSVYVYSQKDMSSISESEICCGDYIGPLYADMDAQKSTLKNMLASKKSSHAMRMYYLARSFFLKCKPDVALVSQVEGIDGKVFISAAKAAGAEVLVPTDGRVLGGMYFSPDDRESFFPDARLLGNADIEDAKKVVMAYREYPEVFAATMVDSCSAAPVLSNLLPSASVRFIRAVSRWYRNRRELEFITVRVAVQNNLPIIRDCIWKIRARVNRRYNNIDRVADLPDKYIYYPLQYTPESSINTPAPYFVDQLRAVDALRYAMPNDVMLVVKEHPACIKTRRPDLVKELMKRPGVMVVRYDIPSIEIIRRSLITVSVTGTAVMEAALLGVPAIALGAGLAANLSGGCCGLDSLADRIRSLIDGPFDDASLIQGLTKFLSAWSPCKFSAPGLSGEPVLRSENIKTFTDFLMRFIGAPCR